MPLIGDMEVNEQNARGESTGLSLLVRAALEEDIGNGDITSLATVPMSVQTAARVISKGDGVIAGLNTPEAVFGAVDPSTRFTAFVTDGTVVAAGDLVFEVTGSAHSLLSSERTALNFLGRLSGIATLTALFVHEIQGTNAKIIDTRKTTPGWRMLEKRAVVAGGGANHRIGLYDMALIKENHIRSAGGITQAVTACRDYLDGRRHLREIQIEVETTSPEEIDEALAVGCDRIMLDNMSTDELASAVQRVRRHTPSTEIEASGNMTVDRVGEVARTGVDFISVGALTHSASVLDLSMLFEDASR